MFRSIRSIRSMRNGCPLRLQSPSHQPKRCASTGGADEAEDAAVFVVEPVPFKTPGPVLWAHGAGGVHAVAGVQAEDVLQGEDRHVGD